MKIPVVKTPIQIRYSDIDPYGHVSNSVYMQYFDMGRRELFNAIEQREGFRQDNVVASIRIDMLREIILDDEVWLETWCSKRGNKSLTVEQHIYCNEKLATTASIILVGFDRGTRETVLWPSHWQPSEREDKSKT